MPFPYMEASLHFSCFSMQRIDQSHRAVPLSVRSNTRGEDGGSRSGFFKVLTRDNQDGLFNGLRVRMGVATGTKTKQQDIKSTLVWEQAKGELGMKGSGDMS